MDQAEAAADPGSDLIDFAETPRSGEWTLRSALVRFAQPEPVRAAAVLDLIRRCEWAIHPRAKIVDGQLVELARLIQRQPGKADELIATYQSRIDLTNEQLEVLAILSPILVLDELAETLAAWAGNAPADPPTALVDEICLTLNARLSELGISPTIDPGGAGRGRPRRN